LVEVLEYLGRCGALERVDKLVVELRVFGEVVEDGLGVERYVACVCLYWWVVSLSLTVFLCWSWKLRTLKKYRSRASWVLGASLPLKGVWPSMTMTKHIKDASVRSIGVRIHAKRPNLPMFAGFYRIGDSCVKCRGDDGKACRIWQ
jgi:hypothetical protein